MSSPHSPSSLFTSSRPVSPPELDPLFDMNGFTDADLFNALSGDEAFAAMVASLNTVTGFNADANANASTGANDTSIGASDTTTATDTSLVDASASAASIPLAPPAIHLDMGFLAPERSLPVPPLLTPSLSNPSSSGSSPMPTTPNDDANWDAQVKQPVPTLVLPDQDYSGGMRDFEAEWYGGMLMDDEAFLAGFPMAAGMAANTFGSDDLFAVPAGSSFLNDDANSFFLSSFNNSSSAPNTASDPFALDPTSTSTNNSNNLSAPAPPNLSLPIPVTIAPEHTRFSLNFSAEPAHGSLLHGAKGQVVGWQADPAVIADFERKLGMGPVYAEMDAERDAREKEQEQQKEKGKGKGKSKAKSTKRKRTSLPSALDTTFAPQLVQHAAPPAPHLLQPQQLLGAYMPQHFLTPSYAAAPYETINPFEVAAEEARELEMRVAAEAEEERTAKRVRV